MSPFAYNETAAMDNYALTKRQAEGLGYNWSDYEHTIQVPEGVAVIKKSDYTPQERDMLKNDDAILNKIFICEVSGKPFRIVKKELLFYRTHTIPLP